MAAGRVLNGKRYIMLLNTDITRGWQGNLDIADLHVISVTNVWNGASYAVSRSGTFSRAAVSLAAGEMALLDWKVRSLTVNLDPTGSLEKTEPVNETAAMVDEAFVDTSFSDEGVLGACNESLSPTVPPDETPPAAVLPALGLTWDPQASADLRINLTETGGPPDPDAQLPSHVLEASPDLTHWTPLHTNAFVSPAANFSDSVITNFKARFYRLRIVGQ
jgi:hypothetical protein